MKKKFLCSIKSVQYCLWSNFSRAHPFRVILLHFHVKMTTLCTTRFLWRWFFIIWLAGLWTDAWSGQRVWEVWSQLCFCAIPECFNMMVHLPPQYPGMIAEEVKIGVVYFQSGERLKHIAAQIPFCVSGPSSVITRQVNRSLRKHQSFFILKPAPLLNVNLPKWLRCCLYSATCSQSPSSSATYAVYVPSYTIFSSCSRRRKCSSHW